MADAWTGNEAVDRFRDDEDARKRFNARNHPNAQETDFTEWMVTSPNSMVDQFATGATIEDTVTPANPTPPTNISYWGETPPNSPEMVAAATPDENTYAAPERAEELTPEMQELEDARRPRLIEKPAGDPGDPTVFAPSEGGMSPEAAGTEEVITKDIESGEDTVTIPVAISAGVVGYTRIPNATHPSNEDPQEVLPPDQGGGGNGGFDLIDLTSITPETMVVGTGVFSLTVNGTGFDDTCVILFRDMPVTTTFVSPTELTSADVPVSSVVETVDVEVQRGSDLSDVLTFDFVAASRDAAERKSERKPSKKKGKASKSSKSSKSSKGRR